MNVIKEKIQKHFSQALLKRIGGSAFWAFSGGVLSKIMLIITGIICVRILGSAQYGEYGYVRSTINTFFVLGAMGLGTTATKFIAENRDKDHRLLSSVLLISNITVFLTVVVTSIILFLNVDCMGSLMVQSVTSTLGTSLRLGIIILFFTAVISVQQGTLAGFEDFRFMTFNTAAGSACELLLVILLTPKFQIKGALLACSCGYCLTFILNHIVIIKELKRFHISISLKDIRLKDLNMLWSFTLPAALVSIIVPLVFWIGRTILVKAYDFSSLALFEIADQWRIMILLVPAMLTRIIFPILSNLLSNGNINDFFRALHINIVCNMGIAAILALSVIILSPVILRFYSPEYTNCMPMILLALSTIFAVFTSVIMNTITSMSKMWMGAVFNLLWGFQLIIYAMIFIHLDFKNTALPLAILISYIVHSVTLYIFLKVICRKTFHSACSV